MGKNKTWADVTKGDRVELNGRTFTVTKYKAKGKRAKVAVTGAGISSETVVKLTDAVTILPPAPLTDKQRDAAGWHKPSKAERRETASAGVMEIYGQLGAGNPAQVKPPVKPGSDAWNVPRDKVEKRLEKMLGAHLVGESLDEGGGYYVPPVDATTVAAHWMLFHSGDDWQDVGEAELLAMHRKQHEDALSPESHPDLLKVNHWHTETRPDAS